MRLYHFTTEGHVSRILERGISVGSLKVTSVCYLEYPWFTIDPSFDNQKWDTEGLSEVRISVKIPGIDDLLAHWPSVAKQFNFNSLEYDTINSGCDPDHWYLYLGCVYPEWFTTVKFKNGKTYSVIPKDPW